MKKYGLIGKTLKHSFSKGYFTEKFEKLGLAETHVYNLYELAEIQEFTKLIETENGELCGLNITIPYKQSIMAYLDIIDEAAAKIGAVNTIKFLPNGKLKGYNTDYWGFRWTLEQWVPLQNISSKKALILGKGGAALAVEVALQDLGFEVKYVSRNASVDNYTYAQLSESLILEYPLIVNSTPLGMYPNVEDFPPIPYSALTKNHFLYDLVYNPLITRFLEKGKEHGAYIHSGLSMLHGQAEKAWEIWNLD